MHWAVLFEAVEIRKEKCKQQILLKSEKACLEGKSFGMQPVSKTVVSLHWLRMSQGEINKALNGMEASLHYLQMKVLDENNLLWQWGPVLQGTTDWADCCHKWPHHHQRCAALVRLVVKQRLRSCTGGGHDDKLTLPKIHTLLLFVFLSVQGKRMKKGKQRNEKGLVWPATVILVPPAARRRVVHVSLLYQ